MADVLPFPFATVQELKDRWPGFPSGAEVQAGALLEDASQFILDVVPSAADATPETRRRVVCAVVRRAMQADDGMVGVESVQQGAGPFQATFKSSNPGGDLYLTRNEKIALGWRRQRAFSIDLLAVPDEVP